MTFFDLFSISLNEEIEDILIALSSQYHLIHPLAGTDDLFAYYVLDSEKSNLTLARRKLKTVESNLNIE